MERSIDTNRYIAFYREINGRITDINSAHFTNGERGLELTEEHSFIKLR